MMLADFSILVHTCGFVKRKSEPNPGIRPSLPASGENGFGDFHIARDPAHPRVIHLVGIDSPALTSAPAIARHVCDMPAETYQGTSPGWAGSEPARERCNHLVAWKGLALHLRRSSSRPKRDPQGGVRVRAYARIGASVTLCPGVVVGRNSLVGAGSVVVRDVPDDAVVAGNPARVIKRVQDLRCPPGHFSRPYLWPPYADAGEE